MEDVSEHFLDGSRVSRLPLENLPLQLTSGLYSNKSMLLGLYIICGTQLLLLLLIVIVGVKKYRSFSKRLKQIEKRDEHMYANLGPPRAASVYDQLQLPKSAPQKNDADYVLPN